MASAQRPEVDALRARPRADVLIVGGGINGIATFRDLALQGVDVVLVERGDFVCGASSASSHMVHGGIRYLENGEFRLVKEAVQERNRLLRLAPHYVRPLETTIPIFTTFSGILAAPFRLLVTHGRGRPRERGALLITAGLLIYDLFSRDGGSVPRHRLRSRARSLQELPHLNPRIRCTATYYDASMRDPERLALDVLHDGVAAGAGRARAVNYVAAVGADDDAGTVRLRDDLTGEEFDVSARVVVNASGPWTDLTNAALGAPTRFMGGTKGSHIVLDHPELLAATGGRELFFEHSDGRIVLIYPLAGRVLVGTTDVDADPRDHIVCTDDEVDYFFDLVRHVFPAIEVDASHIVYAFAGIRPLPRHDDTAPGFVSRDYRIEHARRGRLEVLSLVGGKWTTFRALAEHLSTRALEVIGLGHRVSTAGLAIGGGRGFPRTARARREWVLAHAHGHEPAVAASLLERYGTRAAEVLAAIPVGAAELDAVPGYFAAEIAHLVASEQVVHLSDLVLRRTSIAFCGGVTERMLRQLADAAADAASWDDERVQWEVADTIEVLRRDHRVEMEHSWQST
ncbi:FAD-dependent oxidoreductase [Microbacterium fluvii]|uniref:FAD-dependent oxidoreductase n=1 Tax=Microbacterium fluvii TaxID=415215 RepID=A0ABW2H9A9_9MICO|nr:glycerol-3-phosphate dehydrogenase/oxidase [Microbacterium fluvii]MCU4671562.1 glycerol-3-phosphate dehydrogenase/oxidase [Microbacterium fluvii]